jgi:predicted RNA-binding Zn-ribbon protein involved in translation (DUF1610 family)
MMTYLAAHCNCCGVLVINGHVCHEISCPESWKGIEKECKWCGFPFIPKNGYQEFCCPDCEEAYQS